MEDSKKKKMQREITDIIWKYMCPTATDPLRIKWLEEYITMGELKKIERIEIVVEIE